MNFYFTRENIKRICILLGFVCIFTIALFIMPMHTDADWIEDGQKCELCEEWDEDGEICDDCHCHYNDVCCEWTHCPDCGECLVEVGDFCDECGRCPDCQNACAFHCMICGEHIEDGICDDCNSCEDCALEMGFHCSLCGECMAGSVDACPTHGDAGNDSHCVNCGLVCASCGECFIDDPDWYNEELNMCIDCAQDFNLVCVECLEYSSDVCEVCGLCPSCADDYGYHCSECGECTMPENPCPDGGEHCRFCCEDNGWLCPQCDHCAEACGIDICPYCGLCEICCAENAEAEGCSCGDVCIEGPDWEDHFCGECGECFDDVDKCDDCGLCIECCAQHSMDEGCTTGEICVESGDFGDHFCDECGECFCEKDYCDNCGLCVECCEERSQCSEGMCIEDSDYEEHFCSECGKCFHEVSQCEECDKNGEHICLDCCENASHTEKLLEKSAPKIIRQPEDYEGECSTDEKTVKATFIIKLKNSDGATYKWQVRKAGGTWSYVSDGTTNTLVVDVDKMACLSENLYEYRCIVENNNGSTTSEIAGVYGRHRYGSSYSIDSTEQMHGHACVYCGSFDEASMENHKFSSWTVTKEATESETGSSERTCAFCGFKETQVIAKVHTHKWSTAWGHTYDTTREDYYYHYHICLLYVDGVLCTAKTDYERHTFGELVVTTAPTELKTGSGYRVCTVCSQKVEETIPKLGHTHDFLEDDYDASAYTEDVYKENETYDEFYHWKICQKKVNGKICGYKYATSLHTYGNWWDEEGSGTTLVRSCSVCGYKQTHVITDEEKDMYLITVKNGVATVNGNSVMFVPAGTSVTITSDNSYFNDGMIFKEWDPATIQGLTITSGSGTTKTVTFTMPAQKVRVTALAKECTHKIGKASCVKKDSSTAIEPGCFTNGKNADGVCSLCGKVVREGSEIEAYTSHDYKLDESTVKLATCTSTGYTGDKVCSRCGDIEKGEKIAKIGHSYSKTEIITEATCHNFGRYGQKCAVCSMVKLGATIDRLAHTASEKWSTDAIGHWKVCSNDGCDAIAAKKAAHADSNGDFVCDTCGYEMKSSGEFIVTFYANGGTCDVSAYTTLGKQLSSLPTAERDNYEFKGWFTSAENGNKIDSSTVFSANTTVYAQWEKSVFTPGVYPVEVNSGNGGRAAVDISNAGSGTVITITLTPDENYVSNGARVTQGSGSAISVTKVSDNVYTFVMPESIANVYASFTFNGSGTETQKPDETSKPGTTPQPSAGATSEPTSEPASEPTLEPTSKPTDEPTDEPTDDPTIEPTIEPTAEVTDEPIIEPTDEATDEPRKTASPTLEPGDEKQDGNDGNKGGDIRLWIIIIIICSVITLGFIIFIIVKKKK